MQLQVSFHNFKFLILRNLDCPSPYLILPDLTSSLIILNLMSITACLSGHNFGSEHDPDTTECAPAESDGGKFIMYPASVSGQWPNNKVHVLCKVFTHLSQSLEKADSMQ